MVEYRSSCFDAAEESLMSLGFMARDFQVRFQTKVLLNTWPAFAKPLPCWALTRSVCSTQDFQRNLKREYARLVNLMQVHNTPQTPLDCFTLDLAPRELLNTTLHPKAACSMWQVAKPQS